MPCYAKNDRGEGVEMTPFKDFLRNHQWKAPILSKSDLV
jgi:hypothetical protein